MIFPREFWHCLKRRPDSAGSVAFPWRGHRLPQRRECVPNNTLAFIFMRAHVKCISLSGDGAAACLSQQPSRIETSYPLPACHASPFHPSADTGNDPRGRSILYFSYNIPLAHPTTLQVGFSRPLEAGDLWELTPSDLTNTLTRHLENEFFSRCPLEKRPAFLRDLSLHRGHDESLFKALHQVFRCRWWTAGVLYFIGETLRTAIPLVTKVFLTWLTDSYAHYHLPQASKDVLGAERPRGVGFGIGLAFVIFTMQQLASLFTNYHYMIMMTNGLRVRSALIGNIFRKSMRLSGRARVQHDVGQITTLISMDSARVDEFSGIVHDIWVAPLQLILCMSLLISNLGYSALVGFTVLIVGAIPGSILSIVLFKQRRAGMEFTDARMRLTTEVLQGIRVLKAYGWETFYAHQIETWRRKEVHAWKICGVAYAGLAALVGFIPIVAAILSFITYSLTNHDLNIAVIFSSLQLFNLILAPLETFSIALGSLSGAIVSFKRISTFLVAEELAEPYPMNADSKYAVDVDGDFTWEIAEGIEEKTTKESAQIKEDTAFDEVKDDQVLPVFATSEKGEELEEVEEDKMPYSLKGLKMRIQRGQFIAIVGRVGSGKSSVLQALIGEMRKTSGNVTLGGTISYTPQRPWIRNATVRENILFGQPVDEARLRQVIRACREKGINLSGGQKARVALARAAYSDTDIAILDDPISALDAHVGKAVLENCLLSGPLADRTRILVTHALHVLPKVDYIYVVENGQIVEQGTYTNLVRSNLAFARVLEEFGSQENTPGTLEQADRKQTQAQDEKFQAGPLDAPSQLMQEEERVTGAVTWGTYSKYFNFGGGIFWVALIIVLLLAEQTLYVAISLFLSFWTSDTIPGFTRATYMTVYGILGGVNALASFFVALSFFLTGLTAASNLFHRALASVLKSPIAFFDTTPMGRVVARFSKDQDVLDSQLPAALYHLTSTVMTMIGTAGLVFYTFPYLGIIFVPMIVFYFVIAKYYRRSSIEIKRLDSLMRSKLSASYSEALTGLPTIRAHRIQETSINTVERDLDMQNRAYYVSIGIQRWLAVRLELSVNTLVLGILLFGAGFRETVDPSKVALVLTYTLSAASLFTQVVDLFAGNEQNMNSVERLLAYTELLPEGTQASTLAKHNDPSPSWPAKGGIEFIDVSFAYRDGLPLVLRDVTFHVRPGEKIAIVGRTGSGKSSLLQALLRLTELCAGKITIDGVDALNVGLDVLRSRIAFVPQEGALFLGTLRENLDPHKSRTDVELVLILQRVGLLPPNGTDNAELEKKFSLDAVVGDEGQNYSAGERQLLALCRALVKDSRIIVLDEATSNVDIETDAHIQRTIQTEWKESTLVCIAHRLNTIAYYDRVLVMDSGKVVDFDTVLSLFDKGQGIFRALCDEASLTREEVCRIRAVANGAQ
ncbi:ATP-binding cassette transporter C [Pleurotus pulmonarius]